MLTVAATGYALKEDRTSATPQLVRYDAAGGAACRWSITSLPCG
jgi:hypothetical protein